MKSKDHRVFHTPKSPDTKAWRYMDFTKFVSMLDTGSLYFARSDMLGDPFEGTRPRVRIKVDTISAYATEQEIDIPSSSDSDKLYRWLRNWTFINCWHANEYESDAMWKLYAKTNEAIAIQSTYRRLLECIPDAHIELVHYIDYESDFIKEDNTISPFVHKRIAFEHERELRAIIQELPVRDSKLQRQRRQKAIGIYVSVDFDALVERIYVAPTAPSWFRDLVHNVARKYNSQKEVHQSLLDSEPYY